MNSKSNLFAIGRGSLLLPHSEGCGLLASLPISFYFPLCAPRSSLHFLESSADSARFRAVSFWSSSSQDSLQSNRRSFRSKPTPQGTDFSRIIRSDCATIRAGTSGSVRTTDSAATTGSPFAIIPWPTDSRSAESTAFMKAGGIPAGFGSEQTEGAFAGSRIDGSFPTALERIPAQIRSTISSKTARVASGPPRRAAFSRSTIRFLSRSCSIHRRRNLRLS